MRTAHLSPRSLRRAIKRTSAPSRLCGRQSERYETRFDALIDELERRGLELTPKTSGPPHSIAPRHVPKHPWSLAPSKVIDEFRKSHGIGLPIATRLKRKRRRVAELRRELFDAASYGMRLVRRVSTGDATQADFDKHTARVDVLWTKLNEEIARAA